MSKIQMVSIIGAIVWVAIPGLQPWLVSTKTAGRMMMVVVPLTLVAVYWAMVS